MQHRAVTHEDIRTALRTVRLPDNSADLVEAGRISGITVKGSHIGFVLEADAGDAGQLEQACKRALTAFPGIEQVSIVTTNHSHSSPSRGEAGWGAEKSHTFPLQTILQNARVLRKTMTDAETLLWNILRREGLGVKFRRQHPVGNYVADFACLEKKCIVELDGGQHYEAGNIAKDTTRTAFLESQGFTVLRFANNDMLQNTDAVIESIYRTLHPGHDVPSPTLPLGERERLSPPPIPGGVRHYPETSPTTKRAHYNTTPIPGVTRIIAIASGKGGVGKSTLTLLLAHALAARGEPVAIVDADIHGPSIPRMLGLDPTPPQVRDGLMLPARAHGIMANSIGLVGGDTAAIWRGPMVTKALHQLLRGTDWRNHSLSRRERAGGEGVEIIPDISNPHPDPLPAGEGTTLLIDLPPGTGDIQLTLMQATPVSAAIVITTPQEIALADARKAATMFRKIGVPILGIVENMSYFETPGGTRYTPFGTGGGRTLAESFNVPLLAQLPLDPTIGSALDTGQTPLTESLAATLHPLLEKILLA